MTEPVDLAARRAAVDPTRSVIVQAPAGSGKTSLLVERFLALLLTVEHPEAILAITFTRKAAGEMRERILAVLDPDFTPQAPHESALAELAQRLKPKLNAWRLLDNPHRLLIRTIDSFNHTLARAMPVASRLGPVPSPANDAGALYRHAVRRLFSELDSDAPNAGEGAGKRAGEGASELARDLATLLAWRDNNSQALESLLAGMLGQREQWRRIVGPQRASARALLEQQLTAHVAARLSIIDEQVRQSLEAANVSRSELAALLAAAANWFRRHKADDPTGVLLEAFIDDAGQPQDLPSSAPEHLDRWRAWARIALVGKDARLKQPKSINRSLGFPSGSRERDAMMAIQEALQNDDRFAQALNSARLLPEPEYSDHDWQVLEALLRVLIRAAAEFEVLCADLGETDYAGIADAALRGLGEEAEQATDLGLYLDARLEHLLIDEFQDTNWPQQWLLEKLTAGWQPDDGRTLFLVGDPMQSIYRFRDAEVGLFLRNREHGIGHRPLEPLTLRNNFRSRAEIVAWVNERIGPLFPEREDSVAGAVPYAASTPGRDSGGQVDVHAWHSRDAEAVGLVQIIEQALAQQARNPDFRVAIIVRARSHLNAIVPALQNAGIPFRALKLEKLSERQTAIDLLALTRVLVAPGDRPALLAVLRSPIGGLSLTSLVALCETADQTGGGLDAAVATAPLDADERTRATRVFDALSAAWMLRGERRIRDRLESVWRRLGGPDCLRDAAERRDAESYFHALEQAESVGQLSDWNDWLAILGELGTEGDPPTDRVRVEVLTLHGAKGLEWDMVILPALERAPNQSTASLLHWLPYVQEDLEGQEGVLLAPDKSAAQTTRSALASYINQGEQRRGQHELQRLLYVAATRAREHLVVSATLDTATKQTGQTDAPSPARPRQHSLAATLWPTLEAAFTDDWVQQRDSIQPKREEGLAEATARRLPLTWQPRRRSSLGPQGVLEMQPKGPAIDFDWAGADARRLGTVLHRLLERIGRTGIEALSPKELDQIRARTPILLRTLGVARDDLARCEGIVSDALSRVLTSSTGRWVLSAQHADAACELSISGVLDGSLVHAVIDRTFVAAGERWIIDYKSGHHEGSDLTHFFAEERARYRDQLNRYRRLFTGIDDRPIRIALYLPRHDALLEIDETDYQHS
ncbi:MAG: UvrD-helicase domain-containing protein [Pseudomonadota bacterium]